MTSIGAAAKWVWWVVTSTMIHDRPKHLEAFSLHTRVHACAGTACREGVFLEASSGNPPVTETAARPAHSKRCRMHTPMRKPHGWRVRVRTAPTDTGGKRWPRVGCAGETLDWPYIPGISFAWEPWKRSNASTEPRLLQGGSMILRCKPCT
eukprot:365987-Chlamydomonas_euryale.AAC.26